MKESSIDPKIFDLIQTTDFETLSLEDKSLVRTHLSEEEYKSMREAYSSIEATYLTENYTTPDKYVKFVLDKKFADKHFKRTEIILSIQKIFSYKIPAYQVGLAGLFLLISLGVYKKIQNNMAAPENLMAIADTVFVEKVLPAKVDTIYLYKEEKRNTANTSTTPEQPFTTDEKLAPIEIPTGGGIRITDFSNISVPGSTIKEDSLPMNFMVKAEGNS